jgi:putative hydrolase of the HAD superfamily
MGISEIAISIWYSGRFYFCIMENSETKLRNIIFDLGGVLIDLDISRTGKAFGTLGVPEPIDEAEHLRRAMVYSGLETGAITPETFRNAIRGISPFSISDIAIDYAWNAMLLDFPVARVEILTNLRRKYRLFLLSNSNAIHYEFYTNRFRQDYSYEMDSLFEKVYYSFEMHMRKPNQDIFQKVIADNELLAFETLFIDDSIENIQTAARLGLQAHHLVNGEDVVRLFRDGIWKG